MEWKLLTDLPKPYYQYRVFPLKHRDTGAALWMLCLSKEQDCTVTLGRSNFSVPDDKVLVRVPSEYIPVEPPVKDNFMNMELAIPL